MLSAAGAVGHTAQMDRAGEGKRSEGVFTRPWHEM